MMRMRKCAYYVALTTVVTCVILALNVVLNLVTIFTMKKGRFAYCDSGIISGTTNNNNAYGYNIIPRRIHQIFFNATDRVIPLDLEIARKSWVLRNPSFVYTLWNTTMVLDLLESKYPQLLPLYQSYSHWVRRADVARYVILHEYGGLYVDLDIGSRGKTEVLINSLDIESNVALYLTKPFGVSNDFMLATPKHPFFKHVLCGLKDGNRWYILPSLTTIMATGPGYLYSRYKTYDEPKDVQILRESQLKPFIKHQDGSAWHGIDAKITWWIFINWERFIKKLLLKLCGALLLIWVLFKLRYRFVQLVKLFLKYT